MNAAEKSRITLGLFIEDIWEQNPVNNQWAGVLERARELDVNIICFAGGLLSSVRGFGNQSNIIYNLADAEKIDGLIVWSSGLSSKISREEMIQFLGKFHSIPMITVENKYEGIPGWFLMSIMA